MGTQTIIQTLVSNLVSKVDRKIILPVLFIPQTDLIIQDTGSSFRLNLNS